MEPSTKATLTDGATSNTAAVDEAAAGITTLASQWLSATVAQAQALMELASAEAKLAATSVGLMVVFAIVAAVFVLGAWGLVVAGLVLALVEIGVPLWGALAVLGLLHAVGAVLLWRTAIGLTQYVEFSATRTELQRVAPHETEAV